MACSVPITYREVDSASHSRPSSAITVAEARPLSAGYPVAGSMICPYLAPSSPMKPQMQRHPYKAPVSGNHVQGSGKGTPAADRQKGKGMAGKNNAADHGDGHTEQYKNHQQGLPDSHRRIIPFQKIPVPFAVQDMMRLKQNKHPDSQPFMSSLPYQLIGH